MKNYHQLFLRSLFALILGFMVFPHQSFAQSAGDFTFQGVEISIPENIESVDFDKLHELSGYKNTVFAWVQFNEIPFQEQQDAVKNGGIELIEYIANATYLARFDKNVSREIFTSNNVKGIIPVAQEVKIESEIRNGSFNPWAIKGNNAKVIAVIFKGVNMEDVKAQLTSSGAKILEDYSEHFILELEVSMGQINSLGDFAFVKWVEEITAPSVKEDTGGKSLHRSNGLDTQTSTGRQYTGENIGVMVRDDGIVGPHIDFQGRIDNSTASGTGQTHGDGVAGILTGAGNLDPTKRGMAAGANVYVSNYASTFLDAATVDRINNGSVQITNSSYGNGCNAGYTTTSVNVDNQIYNNPTVLHVFSAGNSGTSNCGFGAGAGWGNITGGHKQGKNVIATANTFFDGSLAGSSSKGPAYDGRIKPDITAHGQGQLSTDEDNDYLSFGGTSGAAPGIAGVSAQLYQAYSEANGGMLPPSALIKATLLNTANDAGNIGPDFNFGWGIVNGLRAGMLIEDGRYLSNSVSQGGANSHSITIPSGTKQVRFMLYWMEQAASNGASSALINDLDLVVTDPGSTDYFPWILNPAPNAATLNLPATTGADHLNNMEQVLINNPSAGTYTLDVSGFAVPFGPQEYYIVYEIISDEITVTYPNRGEHLVPGEQESIRWDAPESSGSFTIEYSADNGSSWNSISTVASDLRTYEWTIPNNVTGTGLVRVTRGGISDVSDSTFSIAPLVTGQTITQVCPTAITFSWNATPGANNYDVYVLGTNFMDNVGNSTSTTFTHTITDPNAPVWYAVVAKNSSLGWESRRSIASYYGGGVFNCIIGTDVELTGINNAATLLSPCNTAGSYPEITVTNGGTADVSNFPVTYQLTGQALVSETYTGTLVSGQSASYTFTTPLSVATNGTYTLTCTATVSGDGFPANDEQMVDIYVQSTATATPFVEDFEGTGFLPVGWTFDNPDNDETWQEASVTGASGATTDAAFVNNYTYNDAGQEDYFETEIFFVGGSTASMTFDVAKANYSAALQDSLAVQISDDCGSTWTTIWAKGGTDLATGGTSTGNWSPSSANDWRNESVDLTSYLGQNVSFRFINITGYGNSTFVDNINVMSDLSVGENDQVNFTIYPNPTNSTTTLVVSNQLTSDSRVVITNQVGQTVQELPSSSFTNNEVSIDLAPYQRGIYFVTVYTNGLNTTKRIVKN